MWGEENIRTEKRLKTNKMLSDRNNVISEKSRIEQKMLLQTLEYFT